MIPSEKYLLSHRVILFFDEWGFYTSLFILLVLGYYLLMIPVFLFGVFAIGYSYKKQWEMENSRFSEKEPNENSNSV